VVPGEPTGSTSEPHPAPGQVSSGPQRFTNLEFHGVVGSTNLLAAEAAQAGAKEGLVVVAEEQAAGRGRRGRPWVAPAGSALLCSILFRPQVMGELPLIPAALALSARAALVHLGLDGVGLKWPNDLVIGGRKLAGILAEVVPGSAASDAPALVVGLGLNLVWPPGWPDLDRSPALGDLLAQATTVERASGRRIGRDELLAQILSELEARYASLADAPGRAELMAEYRQYCETIGARVRVELVSRSVTGLVTDVADDGRLLLKDGPQILALNAGDVVHLRRSAE
jgi:BirA family biotin operon repressor/biotin-[acetyl-CoA-carboxylase] ligase